MRISTASSRLIVPFGGGETRIGPLTNREVFVTESELGRAALSLASFFVAKHFTPSPLQSHPPQWTLPRPACAMRLAYCRRTMVGRIGCGGNTLALRRRGEAMTLSPSLRVRRGSSSALRTRLDGNEPGCHVRTRTSARGSKSRPRSSPTTSLRAVTGPRSSFPHPAPALRDVVGDTHTTTGAWSSTGRPATIAGRTVFWR